MDDYKYLSEIESISNNNSFIPYIVQRISSSNYRGVQCSQQNRLTYNYFDALLNTIYNSAGREQFEIHVGDDHGKLQPQAKIYYEIVQKTKECVGKGTINSIKKNTFPDIARMGFLDRYDKDGVKITEGKGRKGVYSVCLSEKGVEYVTASGFRKIKLFTDGVDILTKNVASDLVELLYLNDYGIDSIDILEFMYIISDDRKNITSNDKIGLLLDYRRLSISEKNRINSLIKKFCNPLNRKAFDNKTLLRDYNNWKNESQQIFGLLSNSTYFKVSDSKLILNTGNYGLFDGRTVRGEKPKSEYFREHNVQKNKGYELHHIVPFSKAQNKSDVAFIDNYKNLIYLHSDKHLEFTANSNKNVIMKYKAANPNILFLDFEDSFIIVDINKDALLAPALIPEIKQYNEILLKKFYYVSG